MSANTWGIIFAICFFILILHWAFDNSPNSWSGYPHHDRKEPPMPDPSRKAPAIENFLEAQFGRTTAIQAGKCVPPPIGCGRPIDGFRDELCAREYTISGLCQDCQDDIFKPQEDDDA